MRSHDHIGMYINIAAHCIRRKMDSFAASYGLSGLQVHLLGFLEDAQRATRPVYQRDIEKNFGIRRSSVTNVISNLEQKGYLKRESVPGDARLKQISLTESGREINRTVCHQIDDMENMVNQHFTKEEHASLIQMLDTIIHILSDEEYSHSK